MKIMICVKASPENTSKGYLKFAGKNDLWPTRGTATIEQAELQANIHVLVLLDQANIELEKPSLVFLSWKLREYIAGTCISILFIDGLIAPDCSLDYYLHSPWGLICIIICKVFGMSEE